MVYPTIVVSGIVARVVLKIREKILYFPFKVVKMRENK